MTGFDRNALLVSCAVVCVAAASPAAAQTKTFDIPAQAAQSAVNMLGRQGDVQIIAARKVTRNKRANAVRGNFTVEQALTALLRGTGLKYRQTGSQTFVVVEGGGEGAASPQADPEPLPAPRASAAPQAVPGSEASSEEEIVVTGTNIRGADPVGTKVLKFTRDEIDKAGIGTTQEFLRTLPQNFNQGAQDSFAYGGQGPTSFDASADASNGSSVNIRGLGADSTLVLLNGQRMPPSARGNFVDVSLIPVSALKRVEVMTDGASAIYGSDAIGGVVNFVLRDDFEGAETRVRAGAARGGAEEFQASQAVGARWGSGHGLISYDYYKKWALNSTEREATGGRNYLPAVSTIVPPTERHSVFANVEQDLTDSLTFNGSGMFARRDFTRVYYTDPLYHADSVGYNRQFGFTGALDYKISSGWNLNATGSFSKTHQELNNTVNSSGRISSFFYSNTHNIWTVEGKVDGELFQLPGGVAKLALGGGYRKEKLTIQAARDIRREAYSSYAELLLPLVGRDNAIPLVQALTLSFAGRYEHYSDFGSTFNPRVGVNWSPVADIKLRGTYSTSFRAPSLIELNTASNYVAFQPVRDPYSRYGTGAFRPLGDSPALYVAGVDPNLGPEKSKNWTLGFDFTPRALPGLTLSATYYSIDFRDRIDSPTSGFDAAGIVQLAADGLIAPDTVLRGPSDALIDQLIASAPRFFDYTTPYRPIFNWPAPAVTVHDADLVLDQRTRNLARTQTSGLDLDVSYSFEAGSNAFALGLNGNYIFRFVNQNWSGGPQNETVDTVFNPVDLKLRSYLSWSNKRGFSANLYLNYADSYRYYATYPVQGKISSWTTVDLSLGFDTGKRYSNAFLNDLRLQLSVTNLFDQAPPKILGYAQSRFPGVVPISYDATNANVIGRFVAFQLIKRF